MKLRLHVTILAMALLVAGASSAMASTPEPPVDPVVTTPGASTGGACAVEAAPAPAAGPARDGETIIPLLMVCPPPPPGQRWHDSATTVGRLRVGRAQRGVSLGTAPPHDQYRVDIPITIELDVEGSVLMYAVVQERGGRFLGWQPVGGRNRDQVTLTSDAFYPAGALIEVAIFGRPDFGSELVLGPGGYSERPIVGSTANGGTLLLPNRTVHVNQTVPPRP